MACKNETRINDKSAFFTKPYWKALNIILNTVLLLETNAISINANTINSDSIPTEIFIYYLILC